jgi:hypothetical protein
LQVATNLLNQLQKVCAVWMTAQSSVCQFLADFRMRREQLLKTMVERGQPLRSFLVSIFILYGLVDVLLDSWPD